MEKIPSSRRPFNIDLKDYQILKNLLNLREKMEKLLSLLKFWRINSEEKLVLFSPIPPRPQSSRLRRSLNLTRLLPQLRSVLSHTWMSLSQLDQLVWNLPKFPSSTPLTSQPKLTRVKSKLPRTIRYVLLEKKLDPLKFLSSKKWTLSHSHSKWMSPVPMIMDPSLMLLLARSPQMIFLDSSKRVSETWLLPHYKLDMLPNYLLLTLSRMPLRT